MEKIEKNVDKNSNNITPPSVPVQNEDDGEEERFISYNSHYPGIRAWLSDFNKNPIKNWCRINSVSGRKLQISFYNYNAKKSLLEELADPTQPNPLIAIKYRRQSENEDQAMKCFLTLVPEEEKFTLRITPIEPIQETEIQQ
ncbi:unnamed protein product, partial [Mesorhabditis belari]|uniref:Uncharacterized protein n=1 Tax=Mesorhabditis belari TaxID=2138241 RepID=A0AAF3FJY0_9BILA